jgi:large conductance mechanosensitive channel
MLRDFKAFLLRGNVVDLAVAVVAVVAVVVVVQPITALMRRHKTQPDVESETHPCTECLSDIPRQARRCAFCTSPQEPAPA